MKLIHKVMVIMNHLVSHVKTSDVIECQLACEASFTARDFERATVGIAVQLAILSELQLVHSLLHAIL